MCAMLCTHRARGGGGWDNGPSITSNPDILFEASAVAAEARQQSSIGRLNGLPDDDAVRLQVVNTDQIESYSC